MMMGGGGGMPGAPGGMPGGGGGVPGGAPGGGGGGMRMFGGGGGGGGGFASSLTPEQQKTMKEAMAKAFGGKNPMEMSQEERTAAFAKMREEMSKAGITMPGRGERKAGGGGDTKAGAGETKGGGAGPVMFGGLRGPGAGGGGDAAAAGAPPTATATPGEGRRRGGQGGGPGGGGGAGAAPSGGFGGFTQKELDNAKLPPPPEEGSSQLDVLLRPGLLADVEIIVEKIPNAIYVPAQAIFQKEGKSVVYVKQGNKFVARNVKLLKRSESLMIIAEGLKAGEEISMQDPDAKPSDKKKGGGGGQGGGGGAPAMPMGMGGKKG